MSAAAKPAGSLNYVVFETLMVLSRLCAEGDDALTANCHAISAHLVFDTKSFSDLEGLQCIRAAFIGLNKIRHLSDISQGCETIVGTIPYLVERFGFRH